MIHADLWSAIHSLTASTICSVVAPDATAFLRRAATALTWDLVTPARLRSASALAWIAAAAFGWPSSQALTAAAISSGLFPAKCSLAASLTFASSSLWLATASLITSQLIYPASASSSAKLFILAAMAALILPLLA